MSRLVRGRPTRNMYIENESLGHSGPARIGRASFSKSGRTLRYKTQSFQRLRGGNSGNYYDVETLEVEIDEDVREEYERELSG